MLNYHLKQRSASPDGFVPLCFENHAQDSRVRYTLRPSAKDGNRG